MWLILAATVPVITSVVIPLQKPVPASLLRASFRNVQRTSNILAQDRWVQGHDVASGQAYYYNEQTGESQWEPPQSATRVQSRTPAAREYVPQIIWRVAGVSGVDAGHTLRKHDTKVLSRWNMLEQKLTVSRKQCVVQVRADGSATLTSTGKGATLWRERDGPWCAVQRGESLVLTDGDRVSLDCNRPEGAVFECIEESAVQGGYQQGGYQHDSYQQQGQPQGLPYPWEQLVDQNGAVFYSNPQTGEATWDPPQASDYAQQNGY